MYFPSTITTSKLETWKKCNNLFFLTDILRSLPEEFNIDLVAGHAFAAALHSARTLYAKDKSSLPEQRTHIAFLSAWHAFNHSSTDHYLKHPKGLPNLCRKLDRYINDYFPFESDVYELVVNENEAEAEFSSHAPLHPALKHPETGDPLLYSVRYDARVNNPILGPGILDDKTTKSITEAWCAQWPLSNQMQGYFFVDRYWANPIPEYIIIRGVSLAKSDVPMVELPPIHYNETHNRHWYEATCEEVNDMIKAYKGLRKITYAGNWTCGICKLHDICENSVKC